MSGIKLRIFYFHRVSKIMFASLHLLNQDSWRNPYNRWRSELYHMTAVWMSGCDVGTDWQVRAASRPASEYYECRGLVTFVGTIRLELKMRRCVSIRKPNFHTSGNPSHSSFSPIWPSMLSCGRWIMHIIIRPGRLSLSISLSLSVGPNLAE